MWPFGVGILMLMTMESLIAAANFGLFGQPVDQVMADSDVFVLLMFLTFGVSVLAVSVLSTGPFALHRVEITRGRIEFESRMGIFFYSGTKADATPDDIESIPAVMGYKVVLLNGESAGLTYPWIEPFRFSWLKQAESEAMANVMRSSLADLNGARD